MIRASKIPPSVPVFRFLQSVAAVKSVPLRPYGRK